MIEVKENSKLENFNLYAHFILAVIVSFSLLLFYIFREQQIYNMLGTFQLPNITKFFEITSIILIFIIFNTAFYSYVSYKRLKMLMFSIIFITLGSMELFAFIYKIQNDSFVLSYDLFTRPDFYSSFGRIFFSIGLVISAFVPYDKTIRNKEDRFLKYIPLILFLVFILLNNNLDKFLSNFSKIIEYRTFNMISEYFIALLLILALIINFRSYVFNNNKYLIRLCSGIMVMVCAQLVKMIYTSYYEMNTLFFVLFSTVGLITIFYSVFKYNVNIPLIQLKNAERQITLYAENLEKIVEKRTTEIRKVNSQFITELEYAKSIQQSLLPGKRINFNEATFVSEYFPCERLSGDFYDIYRIDEENIGMYVLDVSGHGISAALMTMFCNNYIKSSERLIKRYRGLKPHRNLKHFYEEFNKMNFPDEMHMVIFFAAYNMKTKSLTYCTGGMNCYPILVRKDGSFEYLDKSKGFPICKISNYFTPEFTSAKIDLDSGDRVIFYTDGLTDKNKNSTMDEEDLVELLKENRKLNLRNLNNNLISNLKPYLNKIDDDITYFIMEVS